MSYNLRSREDVRIEASPPPTEADETGWDESVSDSDSESDSDAIEDDPFYEPYLANENLMNIGRIIRYELERTSYFGGDDEDEEEEDSTTPLGNTRVVPESESLLPTGNFVEVVVPPPPVDDAPDRLCAMDFEGLPRYRLSFMCVRYFEWTGIRNIATASSISNDALMRALCQIPRGRVVPDCAICSYPLWDALDTKCCSQPLCIHCVNRCAECPYCRSSDY